MCESTAFLLKDNREELVLEDVDVVEAGERQVRIVNIFGEEKILEARVRSLSLVNHKILLEPL